MDSRTCGGGIVLSRADYAVVLSGLGFFALKQIWVQQREHGIKWMLPIPLLPLAALLVYFLSNWIVFGHSIPISGAIKTASDLPFNPDLWLRDRGTALVCVSSFVILLLLAIRTRLGSKGEKWQQIFFFWALGNVLYISFLLVSVRWVLANWYFVSPLLQLALLIGISADFALRRLRSKQVLFARSAITLLFLIVAQSQYSRFVRLNQSEGAYQTETIRAAQWCNQNLSQDAVIGLADAGYFGYHVNRRVINLDGLVNGWEFVHACRNSRGVEHLRNQGLTHVATVFGSQIEHRDGKMRYGIPAVFATRSEGNSFMASEQAIVYRASYGCGIGLTNVFVLWQDRPE